MDDEDRVMTDAEIRTLVHVLRSIDTVGLSPNDLLELVDQHAEEGFIRLEYLELVLRQAKAGLGPLIDAFNIYKFLEVFNARSETLFVRPDPGGYLWDGVEVFPIGDVASLLIRLEAYGFPIRPGRIAERISDEVAGRSLLTDAEVTCVFYRKNGEKWRTDLHPSSEEAIETDDLISFKTPTGRTITYVHPHLMIDSPIEMAA
jgi:hypothetical protein